MKEKKELLEAALFMAKDPLMINDISRIIGVGSLGLVKKLLQDLQKEYEKRGIEVVQLPGGWQMQVKADHLPHVAHLTPYSDIKEGCKRTLAIIVYKEPVKQSDIIKMQGNKAYLYIKVLTKKGLINGQKEGRTKILKTTKEFENYFGMTKNQVKQRLVEGLKASKEEAKKEPEQKNVIVETQEAAEPKKVAIKDKPAKKGKKASKKQKTKKVKVKAKKLKTKKKEMKDVEITGDEMDSLRELSLDDFK